MYANTYVYFWKTRKSVKNNRSPIFVLVVAVFIVFLQSQRMKDTHAKTIGILMIVLPAVAKEYKEYSCWWYICLFNKKALRIINVDFYPSSSLLLNHNPAIILLTSVLWKGFWRSVARSRDVEIGEWRPWKRIYSSSVVIRATRSNANTWCRRICGYRTTQVNLNPVEEVPSEYHHRAERTAYSESTACSNKNRLTFKRYNFAFLKKKHFLNMTWNRICSKIRKL